jgi:hypothetical protein
MSDQPELRDRFLAFVRRRHGERIYELLIQRTKGQPGLDLNVALNKLLQEELGGPVPARIEQLFFCTD